MCGVVIKHLQAEYTCGVVIARQPEYTVWCCNKALARQPEYTVWCCNKALARQPEYMCGVVMHLQHHLNIQCCLASKALLQHHTVYSVLSCK